MLRDKGIGASPATWAHEGCPHFSTPPPVAQPLGQVLAFLQRIRSGFKATALGSGATMQDSRCQAPLCPHISPYPPPTQTHSASAMFSKLQGFVGEEMM